MQPQCERGCALSDPETGNTPPLGLEDGSALADLSRTGPGDSRASIERAARLFAGRRGDAPDDPGCAWLDLPPPAMPLERAPRWRASGTMGWAEGRAVGVLRTGPLRFRPGQCDLLHFSLRDGAEWVIRDGGTGSYDPPEEWWWSALAGAGGHNAPVFDGQEPMARAGLFILAGWPRISPLELGAALCDRRGNATSREIRVNGHEWALVDRLRGPFRRVAWHWRLGPGAWRLTADGVACETAAVSVKGDAPLRLSLRRGCESPAYNTVTPCQMLLVEARSPISRMDTCIRLAK